jgi:hypothetical protein
MISNSVGQNYTLCSYVVRAQYDGREPFVVGTFKVPRKPTEQETEADASNAASAEISRFWARHMPDGIVPPHVLDVRLGHTAFIPADHSWRRG